MSDIWNLLNGIEEMLELGEEVVNSANQRAAGRNPSVVAKGSKPVGKSPSTKGKARSSGSIAKKAAAKPAPKSRKDPGKGQPDHGQQSIFTDQKDEETCEGRELAMSMQETPHSHAAGHGTGRGKTAAPGSTQAIARQLREADISRIREGILWSEVLGEPVSVRRRRRREGQYGNRSNAH
jgi:hypothetical protein